MSPGETPSMGKGTPRSVRRRRAGAAFKVVAAAATMVGVVSLAVLLVDVASDGLPRINGDFFSSFASRLPQQAGIKAALAGSLWILANTVMLAVHYHRVDDAADRRAEQPTPPATDQARS